MSNKPTKAAADFIAEIYGTHTPSKANQLQWANSILDEVTHLRRLLTVYAHAKGLVPLMTDYGYEETETLNSLVELTDVVQLVIDDMADD